MNFCPICLIKDSFCTIFTTECGHDICVKCFNNYICGIKQYPTPCFTCDKELSDIECENNVSSEVLVCFNKTKNHFSCINDPHKHQCRDPDCNGIFTDIGNESLTFFICPKCNKQSCLVCLAIHRNKETCNDWEKANSDVIKSRKVIIKENKRQLKARLSIKCVNCETIVQKLEGCDGVLCPVCLTGLCFKTGKTRWGSGGEGDISSGCRCLWDGVTKCHPRCKGCFVHLPINNYKVQSNIILNSLALVSKKNG